MKKIITSLVSLLILSSVISAETIGKRIFEIKVDTESVSVSNNAFGISSFFQEEAVIDLPKIYKELPEKGFITSFSAKPGLAITLNILGVKAGIETGLDTWGSLNLSKDLFKFLGEGNELNKPMTFTGGGNIDIFAYFRAPVSLKVKGISVSAAPSLFVPLVHAEMVDTGATIENDSEGTIKIKGSYAMLIKSGLDIDTLENKSMPSSAAGILGTAGLDLNLGVKVPLFTGLQVTGNINVPLFPGKLVSKAETHGEFTYGKNLLNSEKDIPMEMDKGDVQYESTTDTIHRPLIFMAGVEWKPILDLVRLDGSVGFGIRYPFSQRAYFYPQYYGSAKVSLLNILGGMVSTEYTNETFRHEAAMMFNIRAMEIDTGVALSGSDLKNSLSGKGFGAFITFCIGF